MANTRQTQKSPQRAYLDALWQEYINSDTELRRFYRSKRRKARRHDSKIYARFFRYVVPRSWREKLKEVAGMTVVTALTVAMLMALLTCLA
jgi:hypothetical protein